MTLLAAHDDARGRAPVRLCMIVENHWRAVMGGAPYQGRVIAECLAARPDFEVFYLARRCCEDVKEESYTVMRIGSAAGIRGRAVFFDAPDLWAALKAIDPDVIYQRRRQSYTAVAARYARKYRKRLVFHAASDNDVMPSLFRKHLSLNTPFDWLEGVLGVYGLRRADAIVVQTRRQAELLRASFGLDAAAIIPNMHPEPAANERVDKSTALIQVAWVANFKVVKRPEHFVRLAEDFRDHPSLRFVMAGRPGHERTYRDLHAKIRSLPNVAYVGELTHEQVNELMASSHFLVNTSDVEGFSNTFIQAWMRDTVVLSMNVDVDGALKEQGLGYFAGSYVALRDLLGGLVSRAADVTATAERARRFALENCSTRSMGRLVDALVPSPRTEGA